MPITFYMDHHVPRPVTVGLRRRGIDACIHDLEFLAQAGKPEDFINQVIYLPLD
jgi:hypothetical protein